MLDLVEAAQGMDGGFWGPRRLQKDAGVWGEGCSPSGGFWGLRVSGGREKSLIKKQGLARGEVSLTSMPVSQESVSVDAEVKVGLGKDFYWNTRPYVELIGTG